MADHLKVAYYLQMVQSEEDEPTQRLREADLECGDEEDNLRTMRDLLCLLCRRMRVSRKVHGYVPELEDGLETAVADVHTLLRVLDPFENSAPIKMVALRRAVAGEWRLECEEDRGRETKDAAVKLLRIEVERGFTLAVAAAKKTREGAREEIWGTAAEEDAKVAAAAESARNLELESEGAVYRIAAHAFRK